jgi:hypothetical protein
MTDTTTIHQRIHECRALAAAAVDPVRAQYLAEAHGLLDVAEGRPSIADMFSEKDERAAYERGRADGMTLMKITKGVLS